jgi:flavin-binding protein dodecin
VDDPNGELKPSDREYLDAALQHYATRRDEYMPDDMFKRVVQALFSNASSVHGLLGAAGRYRWAAVYLNMCRLTDAQRLELVPIFLADILAAEWATPFGNSMVVRVASQLRLFDVRIVDALRPAVSDRNMFVADAAKRYLKQGGFLQERRLRYVTPLPDHVSAAGVVRLAAASLQAELNDRMHRFAATLGGSPALFRASGAGPGQGHTGEAADPPGRRSAAAVDSAVLVSLYYISATSIDKAVDACLRRATAARVMDAFRKAPSGSLAAEIGDRVRSYRSTEGLSEDDFARRMAECGVAMAIDDVAGLEDGRGPVEAADMYTDIVYHAITSIDDAVDTCLVRAADTLEASGGASRV